MKTLPHFFIKLLLVLLAMVTPLAGSPRKVDTYFYFSFFNQQNASGSRDVTIELNGETIYDNLSVARLDLQTFSRPLLPGVKYQLRVDKDAGMKFGLSIVNEGFLSKINGNLRTAFYVGNTTASDQTYEIMLVDESVMSGGGNLPVGVATPLQVSDLNWTVGLGNLPNGNAAGFIQYTSEDIDVSNALGVDAFKRSSLGLHIPVTNSGDIVAVYTDEDGDGIRESLRQVKAPQCLADITDDADGQGFTISFYRTGTGGNETTPFSPTGGTLVTYHIDKTGAAGANQLTLTGTDNGGNVVTNVVNKTNNGTYDDWDLTTSGNGISKLLDISNSDDAGNRAELRAYSYSTPPAGIVTEAGKDFATETVYRQFTPLDEFQPEEKMISLTHNKGKGAALERKDAFTYYDLSVGPGDNGRNQFSRMKSYESFFGEWRFFEYHNLGLVETITNPNSPLYSRQIYDFLRWSRDNFYYEAYHGVYALQGRQWLETIPEGDSFAFDVNGDATGIRTGLNGGNALLKENTYGQDWRITHPRLIESRTSYDPPGSTPASFVNRDLTRNYVFPIDPADTSGEYLQVSYDAYTASAPANSAQNHFQYTNAVRYMASYKPHQNATNFDFNLTSKPYYQLTRDNAKTV